MKLVPPPQKREGIQRLGDLPAFKTILESRKLKEGEEAERTAYVAERGPRKREPGEPGKIYDGPNIRITLDAETYMIDAKKPLTTAQQDRIVAAGFDDVSEAEDGSLWLAERWKVARSGADINVLAVVLDGKGERLGRTR